MNMEKSTEQMLREFLLEREERKKRVIEYQEWARKNEWRIWIFGAIPGVFLAIFLLFILPLII